MTRDLRMTTPTRLVLAALAAAKEPLFGLQVARTANLGTGTVYPILHRLASCGLITRTEEVGRHPGRPARRYYTISEEVS